MDSAVPVSGRQPTASADESSWPFDPSTDLGRSYLDVDWSATPLGPLAGWSDSLKSTVRMMLASRFSMWMGWGPGLTFFCNDAYRRDSLGGKYPWALGRPTAEVWSEIWDQLTERVAAVTIAGESTWDEELKLFVQRSGYLEETFHTFSYSPLTDGDASIAGLLCVVNEVTTGVINTRRIATASDLSAGLAAAATEQEVCSAAQERMAKNPSDFPFVAAFLMDDATHAPRLMWSCGLESGHRPTPGPDGVTALDGSGWVEAFLESGRRGEPVVVDGATDIFAAVRPGPTGARPTHAVVAAIQQAGGDGEVGFVVVGASAHRPLDGEYLDFIQLVAELFGAAVYRARAFEAERDQALALAQREHAIAAQLQNNLLPVRDFVADHLDVATYYSAGVEGTEVGGDWFDVIDLGPGRTALVIGDVMGRGVQAASVMGQLRAATRAYARLELPPDTVLGLLDETVRELGQNKIVTCVYAIYDPTDFSLTYANAGHLPPLLHLADGTTHTLDGGGPPLGLGRGWPASQTVTLPIGATLTLITDGLVERVGTDIDEGITALKRLMTTLSADFATLPAQLVAGLMPEGSDDDIAVMIARVSERAHEDRAAEVHLANNVSNVAEARHFATDQLRIWGMTDDLVSDAELIISELVTNAMRHAHSGARLTIRTAGARLFLEVHDDTGTPPQPRNASPSDTSGRGLAIVATLATRWGTRQTPSGKAVWCELSIPRLQQTDSSV